MFHIRRQLVGLFAASFLGLSAIGHGQSYEFAGGGSERPGAHDASPTAFMPGRGFLRWWDPKLAQGFVVDNWEPQATFNPGGNWVFPTGITAFNGFQKNGNIFPAPAEYRLARPVPAKTTAFWEAATGTAATATWTFSGLSAGDEYRIATNILTGPTETASGIVYVARYHAFRIDGVVNPDGTTDPVYDLVDTFRSGNGFVNLGDGGGGSGLVFTVKPATSVVTVTLIATTPVGPLGNLLDTRLDTAVIADATKLVRANGEIGSIISQPVVHKMDRAGIPNEWRVASVRNEATTFQVGTTTKNFSFPVLSIYNASGQLVEAVDTNRRNLIASYPALRPEFAGDTAVARQDYATAKQEWFNGLGTSADPTYDEQIIEVDNTNGNVTYGAGWQLDSVPGELGGSVHLLPQSAGTNAFARFAPVLPDSTYRIEVYVPSATTSDAAEVRVNEGATQTIGRLAITGNAGNWVSIPNSTGGTEFVSTGAAPLSVQIGPGSTFTNGSIPADRVRFIRNSDLRSLSTPVFKTIRSNTSSGVRDVDMVIMALENGQLIGIDADTGEDSSGPNRFLDKIWEYPVIGSPNPNATAGEDGLDINAELPTNFNLSSALVQTVTVNGTPTPVLYIGSNNGRVYAFDLSDVSDGTVKRLWTYPNDYPATSVRSSLGPITGSIGFSDTPDGPVVLVPTVQGRLYALDAAGTGVNKTTTTKWTYPDLASNPIGPIFMTPTVGEAESATRKVVYFGTSANTFVGAVPTLYALRLEDADANGVMDELWTRTTNQNGALLDFTFATPVFVKGSVLGGGMSNTLYSMNGLGYLTAYNSIDGAIVWEINEFSVGASGALGFSYMAANAEPNPGSAMVFVPTTDGSITGYFAQTGRTNTSGSRFGWQSSGVVPGYHPQPAFGSDISPVNSYMYGVDTQGYLLGFSYDPNLPDDGQTLTDGDSPRQIEPTTDASNNALGAIANAARVDFILPDDYLELERRAQGVGGGPLDETYLLSLRDRVTRRAFEFGEAIYVMVSNLPEPDFFSPSFTYTVSGSINVVRQSANRQPMKILPVVAPSDRNRVAIGKFAFVGTGQNALTPGQASLLVQIFGFSGGREQGNRTVPRSNFRPGITPRNPELDIVNLANPLAVRVRRGATTISVGLQTQSDHPDNVANGTPATTFANLIADLRPDLSGASVALTHGTTGLTQVDVYDRALLTLLNGPERGIQGVRMALSDLSFLGNVISPLASSVFTNLEDLPGSIGNNVSLDYPDIRRDRLSVVKNEFGAVENPLFQGVGLLPPAYSAADLTAYNSTPAAYNNGLTRTFVPNTFEFSVDLPRFQPPSTSGYAGPQVVYVDTNPSGRQFFPGQAPLEAYRDFQLAADVAVDQRPVVTTPTVDLGSIPGGGGYTLNGFPWSAALNFRDPAIHDDQRFPFFKRFTVENQGNVNLQNVRVAKEIARSSGGSFTVAMFGNNLNPNVLLDSRYSVHTDIDPVQASAFNGSFLPGAGNRVILQKARPDDTVPTRLRRNPKRRANPNLNVNDGDLIPSTSFASSTDYQDSIADPRIAVSVPIGTASGEFSTDVTVFEDAGNSNTHPFLNFVGGVFEPYSDTPMTLRLKVRETRLTTSRSLKSGNMVDRNLSSTNPLSWANRDPVVARAPNGTLVVAFSSDRLGFDPLAKTDSNSAPQWKIFFTTLTSDSSTVGTLNPIGTSPDLYGWSPSVTSGATNNRRWFNNSVGTFPTGSYTPDVLFGIPVAEMVPGSLQFGNAAFPSSGFANPLAGYTNTGGHAANPVMYMAFTGEVTRITDRERVKESRLFMTQVSTTGSGGVTTTAPVPLEFFGNAAEAGSVIGKPTLVQSGSQATVFFASSSGGNSQILMSSYNGGWGSPIPPGRNPSLVARVQTGSAFENVGNPSATLRVASAPVFGTPSVIELAFTGRLRGRTQTEAYLCRIPSVSGLTLTADPTPFTVAGAPLFEQLINDPTTGLFWARGASWNQVLNGPNAIDIVQRVVRGGNVVFESILDRTTLKQGDGSPILSYETTLGGRVTIDTASGSIRLSGVAINKNAAVYARYSPRFLRISDSTRANYRSVNVMFDSRPESDQRYAFDSFGAPLTSGFNLAHRLIVTYARTSSNDSQVTRPYMKTYRYGIELPNSIATDRNGNVTFNFTGGVLGGYQLDPVNGKVFVQAILEGQTLEVTYQGVTDAGVLVNRTYRGAVRLIEETEETEIPIEQAANETAVSIGLDGMTGSYSGNMTSRPGLMWMFWTSTRGGGSDIFFQTLAPRFSAKTR